MWTWCQVRAVRSTVKNFTRGYVNKLDWYDDLPRITVPHKMVQTLEKLKVKSKLVAAKQQKLKTPVIIACKRNEYNHHKGQNYSDFDPKMLASHGWKHRKSAGDYFTILPYRGNPALMEEKDYVVTPTFDMYELDQQLLEFLKEWKMLKPTKIQDKAIGSIRKGENVICAAETGSGKTLAYLLPILDRFLKQENNPEERDQKEYNAPYAIIIVPSRELVAQLSVVLKRLQKFVPFKLHRVVGGEAIQSHLKWRNKIDVDVLISTPGNLNKMIAAGLITESRLQSLVLDEADTLMDDSFSSKIKYTIQKLKIDEKASVHDPQRVYSAIQVILVSATFPRSLAKILGEKMPVETFTQVSTSQLHRLMPHVAQRFIRVLPSKAPEVAVKIAKKADADKTPTIFFCNTTKTAYWLSCTLAEVGLTNVLCNSTVPAYERTERMGQFLKGECNLLVCTDLASRGVDTTRAQQVINYNFPTFMSDYIHRAGRVGRVGSEHQCQVISFIVEPWDVDLLWKIEIAARKREELHNVNANIKRKLDAMIVEKYGLQGR